MKKNQVAWLNNDSDLRIKSAQHRASKNYSFSAREPADRAGTQIGKAQSIIKEAEVINEIESFTDTPIFSDPRCMRDRRRRQSIFFSALRDRRNETRRGVCSLDTNWWISRNYCVQRAE